MKLIVIVWFGQIQKRAFKSLTGCSLPKPGVLCKRLELWFYLKNLMLWFVFIMVKTGSRNITKFFVVLSAMHLNRRQPSTSRLPVHGVLISFLILCFFRHLKMPKPCTRCISLSQRYLKETMFPQQHMFDLIEIEVIEALVQRTTSVDSGRFWFGSAALANQHGLRVNS